MALDKVKLAAFAKKQAAPAGAAKLLLQKKKPGTIDGSISMAEALGEAEAQVVAPPGDEKFMAEMVEEAAAAAAEGADQDLEDVLGAKGTPNAEAPEWAKDAAKWAEAAQAVGLGDADAESVYDEPGVVAAYLYKQMGGEIEGIDMVPPVEGMEEEAAESPEHEASETPAEEAAEHMPANDEAGALPDEADLSAMVEEAAAAAEEDRMSPEMQDALTGYAEVDGEVPPFVADADKWEKALEAVKPTWDSYPEPIKVVAVIYEKLGGGVS